MIQRRTVISDLLEAVAAPRAKRADIVPLYAELIRAMRAGDPTGVKVDWPAVNAAIIARWSRSGLTWIKTQAWKALE
jgi:hypothetical protein